MSKLNSAPSLFSSIVSTRINLHPLANMGNRVLCSKQGRDITRWSNGVGFSKEAGWKDTAEFTKSLPQFNLEDKGSHPEFILSLRLLSSFSLSLFTSLSSFFILLSPLLLPLLYLLFSILSSPSTKENSKILEKGNNSWNFFLWFLITNTNYKICKGS